MLLQFAKIFSSILFVATWSIGVLSLSVPLSISLAGFLPGVFVILIVWLFSYAISLYYLEATLAFPPGSNFSTIAKSYLGKEGQWIGATFFLFFLYYLLFSYFISLVPSLHNLITPLLGIELPQSLFLLFFFFLIGLILWWGLAPTLAFNALLMIALFFSLFLLAKIDASSEDSNTLLPTNWALTLYSLPVLLSAYGFQALVPTIATFLKQNRRALHITFFFGTFLPCLIYLFLEWLLLNHFATTDLWTARQKSEVILKDFPIIEKIPAFFHFFHLFYFFAIITSLLCYGYALLDFYADFLKMEIEEKGGKKRLRLILLSLFPPFLLALFLPSLFNSSMDTIFNFVQILLSFFPLIFVWLHRYHHTSTQKPMIRGGKFLLALIFVLNFFFLWVQGISLVG